MIEFYNKDCIEGMKSYPDKYFDLAIVDPPYSDGKNTEDNSHCSVNRGAGTEKISIIRVVTLS